MGFHELGVAPTAGCFIVEHTIWKWMMTGGTPHDLGNLQIPRLNPPKNLGSCIAANLFASRAATSVASSAERLQIWMIWVYGGVLKLRDLQIIYFFMGFSLLIHALLGTPIYGNLHMAQFSSPPSMIHFARPLESHSSSRGRCKFLTHALREQSQMAALQRSSYARKVVVGIRIVIANACITCHFFGWLIST